MAFVSLAGFAQVDDMYFIPQKEEPKKTSTVVVTYESPQPAVAETEAHVQDEPVYATGEVRDVDEYNRRGVWAGDTLTADGDSTDAAARSVEPGDDYECSKRILRFCAPTIGVAVSSPLYWDLCYGPNAIYWDVYDDGVFAYAFPSSWSTFYWGPYVSWGWGPYYSYWGWGGPWYAGWYDPWYWRPHWHYPPHVGHPGPGHPGRPVARPSLTHREHSTLARGSARRGSTTSSRTRTARNGRSALTRRNSSGNSLFRPSRSAATRQPAQTSRPAYTPSTTRSSSRSSFSPSSSSRSTFRPSVGMPGRGGGFSPSRGGGARGGRR